MTCLLVYLGKQPTWNCFGDSVYLRQTPGWGLIANIQESILTYMKSAKKNIE